MKDFLVGLISWSWSQWQEFLVGLINGAAGPNGESSFPVELDETVEPVLCVLYLQKKSLPRAYEKYGNLLGKYA